MATVAVQRFKCVQSTWCLYYVAKTVEKWIQISVSAGECWCSRRFYRVGGGQSGQTEMMIDIKCGLWIIEITTHYK